MREDWEARLAARIGALRLSRALSLDDLAARTGASRATLSRVERAETSPTAALLGALAAAFGVPVSALLLDGDAEAPALVRAADQPAWVDPGTGFRRRAASPPGPGLRLELVECELPPGAALEYDAPPVPGMEQHLLMLGGALEFTVGGAARALAPGDCLRAHLRGPTRFRAGPEGARYVIAIGPP